MNRSSLVRNAVAAFMVLVCAGCGDDSEMNAKPESVTVALYAGSGCWPESITAARKMFEWMGYSTELVSASRINGTGLDGFDIVCIPGGDMYEYAQDISSRGKTKIREFVNAGGAYIGICGGAYFASSRVVWQKSAFAIETLGLFRGEASGPMNDIVAYPGYGMCTVNIVDRTHPITQEEPESERILYYWGPTLVPAEDMRVSILGMYALVDRPAIIAFEYGKGRVFLVGTHPEIEEDGSRDGTNFGDALDDQGSDWDLMKRAAAWCLKSLN